MSIRDYEFRCINAKIYEISREEGFLIVRMIFEKFFNLQLSNFIYYFMKLNIFRSTKSKLFKLL